MKLLPIWRQMSPEEKRGLAARLNSSVVYLSHLAHGHRAPSPGFARKLVAAEKRLTLAGLRPDIWGNKPLVRRQK